jgi:hypothetical protein
MRIVYSIIGVIVGFLLMKYSVVLTETLGKMDFAERYLRSGMAGTYTMYRLLGLFIIIFSILYMFNAYGFILGPLAPLFGGGK